MRVWIDVENPPQVQYLLPLRAAFESAGAETVITARDYGETVAMLARAGVRPYVFGSRVGRNKLLKSAAVVLRARDQTRFFARNGRPDVLVGSSRAAAAAAWRMRVPSFIFSDYEHADIAVYRRTGSTILHPDVIDTSLFRRRGMRADRLIPFKGLKEDLTFAGVDVEGIEPHDLGEVPAGSVKVLFRPPSETSHYYTENSTAMARAALEWLANAGALVVFSPRESNQVRLLEGLDWSSSPVVLHRSVPFVALLKSVDAVMCAGGTMLREAAYLGIPAYSIFQSEIGEVDRWLERVGRVTLLRCPEDLARIQLRHRGPLAPLDTNPYLLEHLVTLIAERATQVLQPPETPAKRLVLSASERTSSQ